MSDRSEEARSIALYALGMLIHKDSSVEAAVRAVLRIAHLQAHPHWQGWAQLQLTEHVDEDTAKESVLAGLDAFPDSRLKGQIVESALREYLKDRETVGEGGGHYLADIADIERDMMIFEASLLRKIDIERFAQRDRRHKILNRVKNRAPSYLMMIENRESPERPFEAD